jgi:hypothetical protein
LQNRKYAIDRELGCGGMGAVYLARQAFAGGTRVVVIKEMLDYADPNDPMSRATTWRIG